MPATRYDPHAEHEAWIAALARSTPLAPGTDARMRAALRSAAPRTTRTTRTAPAGEDGRSGSRTGAGGSSPSPARSSPAARSAASPGEGRAGEGETPAQAPRAVPGSLVAGLAAARRRAVRRRAARAVVAVAALLSVFVLLALVSGCRPPAPRCPGGTVARWVDDRNSSDPDAGAWMCVRPNRSR